MEKKPQTFGGRIKGHARGLLFLVIIFYLLVPLRQGCQHSADEKDAAKTSYPSDLALTLSQALSGTLDDAEVSLTRYDPSLSSLYLDVRRPHSFFTTHSSKALSDVAEVLKLSEKSKVQWDTISVTTYYVAKNAWGQPVDETMCGVWSHATVDKINWDDFRQSDLPTIATRFTVTP